MLGKNSTDDWIGVTKSDSNSTKKAILSIPHVDMTVAKMYECTARNKATGFGNYVEAHAKTMVTVTVTATDAGSKYFNCCFEGKSMHNGVFFLLFQTKHFQTFLSLVYFLCCV